MTLRDYRRAAGYTQEELAKAMGVSLSHIKKLECSGGDNSRSIMRMELRNAIRLTELLGITIQELTEIE